MKDNLDLSDTPQFLHHGPRKSGLKNEAKEIYSDLAIAILEPLKVSYKKFGHSDKLLRGEILNRVIISEEKFIELYISEFYNVD